MFQSFAPSIVLILVRMNERSSSIEKIEEFHPMMSRQWITKPQILKATDNYGKLV